MNSRHQLALEAVRRKLVGKELRYEELLAIVKEIVDQGFGEILTTYFTAAGFCWGFSNKELLGMTRAMVETGERLDLGGIVADKHSFSGVPGNRTSLIVIPIISALGLKIPKTSSRAITSAAGTADVMEVLAQVNFGRQEIAQIVKKVGGCIVWGGSVSLAPADDLMIRVERPLAFESYDKVAVSIMAKKIAAGATHLVIDIPVGKHFKIHRMSDAVRVERKFFYLAGKFGIKITVLKQELREPVGRGIGPSLEARDALLVLEQDSKRPVDLEQRALLIAGKLIDLCLREDDFRLPAWLKLKAGPDLGVRAAGLVLSSGAALKKFREIVAAQGGAKDVASSHIKTGETWDVKAGKAGVVVDIDSKNIVSLARTLGCPEDKLAGVYLKKKLGDRVEKDESLCELHFFDRMKLDKALNLFGAGDLFKIE